MITDIIGFIFCGVLITFSGTQLSKHGNNLAELTGLSKAWIGLILMATVTSLPELVAVLSSVIVVKAPDLAAGNILGSCAFNLLILSALDVMVRKPITSQLNQSHLVAGSFSIILLVTAGAAILMSSSSPVLLWVSPFSLILIIIYFLAMRGIFYHDKSQHDDKEGHRRISKPNALRYSLMVYAMHALIVILAALFLPYFAENIAQQTGLSDSFIGTMLLAVTTSLPELVISIAAVRIGSLDMAMGNLLGSNVFNIFILPIADMFYSEGSLYSSISTTHLLSILAAIMMTAVVAIGLVVRPEKKILLLGMDTLVILIIYILLMAVLF